MKKIFAADDWGLNEAVNEGILQLAKRDLLKSVSVLAGGAALDHKLSELLAGEGKFAIHLHFNLTEGRAFVKRSSLTGPDGCYRSRHLVFMQLASGLFKAEDLVAEFELQCQQLQMRGLHISGMNGHHHVHQFLNCVRALEAPLASRGIANLRQMCDPDHLPSFLMGRRLPRKSKDLQMVRHRYLTERDLSSRDAFMKKLTVARGEPLLAHPAVDRPLNRGVGKDLFQHRRVFELRKILEYLG